MAYALSAFATFLARRGLYNEAQTLYQQALTIHEHALGAEHPTVAQTLSRSALVLARLGQRRRATELSARALRIWEKSGAQEGLAGGLITHAQIQLNGGGMRLVRQSSTARAGIRLPLLGPAHPGIAEIEVPLASVAGSPWQSRGCIRPGASRRRNRAEPFTADARGISPSDKRSSTRRVVRAVSISRLSLVEHAATDDIEQWMR